MEYLKLAFADLKECIDTCSVSGVNQQRVQELKDLSEKVQKAFDDLKED